MATQYSGFASRKLEDVYVMMLKKCLSMLSLKVLHYQSGGDFLTPELLEQVSDERLWSKKIFKLYRSMKKLEQRKYNGGHYAPEIR